MNELIDKVDNLISVINSSKEIEDFNSVYKEVMKDKELLEDIKKYNLTQSKDLKEKIIKNKIFRQYKEQETNIYLIIMAINTKLKEISKKGSCNHENN